MKDVNLNIRISENLKKEFYRIASDNAQNPSELIRRWIEKYIEEENRKMEFFKKITDDDVLIMCVDNRGNFSVASRNDPEPLGFTRPSFHGQANQKDRTAGWERIAREEATAILGYDPEEGRD